MRNDSLSDFCRSYSLLMSYGNGMHCFYQVFQASRMSSDIEYFRAELMKIEHLDDSKVISGTVK